jgi:tetratricopeptide (TPR) repeat protein
VQNPNVEERGDPAQRLAALQQAALNEQWQKVVDDAPQVAFDFPSTEAGFEARKLLPHALIQVGLYREAVEADAALIVEYRGNIDNRTLAPTIIRRLVDGPLRVFDANDDFEGTNRAVDVGLDLDPHGPLSDNFRWIRASVAMKQRQYAAAERACLDLIAENENRPEELRSPLVAKARYYVARTYRDRARGWNYDLTDLEIARAKYIEFIRSYEGRETGLVADARLDIKRIDFVFAKKIYMIGAMYESDGVQRAALHQYRKLLRVYPETPRYAALARERAEALAEPVSREILDEIRALQQDTEMYRPEVAIDRLWRKLADEFPSTEAGRQARLHLGNGRPRPADGA